MGEVGVGEVKAGGQQVAGGLFLLRCGLVQGDGPGGGLDGFDAGLEVFASAPLHGGEIPGIVTRELTDLISPGSTPAQAALAVVASAAGVGRVLLSTGNPEHWTQAAGAVGRPPLSPGVLRRVVDVLGT
ncbi:hypothetical protein [Kitasatospora cineracea]|uniref:hypothetical protein n=1 Tax=Kitasatospora cineracea TaxID=88074 RepID=UPI0037A5E094